MEYKTSQEKLKIVFDIITKLKNFETNTGLQDIYLPHFSYVSECTEIFNNYIKKNDSCYYVYRNYGYHDSYIIWTKDSFRRR